MLHQDLRLDAEPGFVQRYSQSRRSSMHLLRIRERRSSMLLNTSAFLRFQMFQRIAMQMVAAAGLALREAQSSVKSSQRSSSVRGKSAQTSLARGQFVNK